MDSKFLYRLAFLLFLLLLIVSGCVAPTPQDKQLISERAIRVKVIEKRLALVIGNADYTHGNRLVNPINDCRDINNVLESLGFKVIKSENCNQNEMRKAIDEFGEELKRYDVGLFFYAGHGVSVKGNNYLIPVDAKLKSEKHVEYDCVRADRVLAMMEAAGSKTNLVILDSCRDNPFERSWHRGTRGAGLAFMNAPSGSLIAYATSPGRTALDGPDINGLYTSAILDNIRTPGISIEKMFKKVRSTVMAKTNNEQIPWESSSLTGEFYFIPPQILKTHREQVTLKEEPLKPHSEGGESFQPQTGQCIISLELASNFFFLCNWNPAAGDKVLIDGKTIVTPYMESGILFSNKKKIYDSNINTGEHIIAVKKGTNELAKSSFYVNLGAITEILILRDWERGDGLLPAKGYNPKWEILVDYKSSN